MQKAVSFLARREHSCLELRYKLSERGYDEDEISAALDRLQEKGLQSDERFAEDFVQSRIDRGHGPVKISAELRQRGISDDLVYRLIGSAGHDWLELATGCYLKKYGSAGPNDYHDKARRLRFLQQRGFDKEQCHYAVDKAVERSR